MTIQRDSLVIIKKSPYGIITPYIGRVAEIDTKNRNKFHYSVEVTSPEGQTSRQVYYDEHLKLVTEAERIHMSKWATAIIRALNNF